MYRPTIRYSDIFREYVDLAFHATHLDRNQIIRGALFVAAQTSEFHELLAPYKKQDVSLPASLWERDQHDYWLEQCPRIKEGGKDVSVIDGGETRDGRNDGVIIRGEKTLSNPENQQATERKRAISSNNTGGIKIKLN